MKSIFFNNIIKEMNKLNNKTNAKKMSEYMKNRFKFLGIPKPKLNKLIKPYIANSRKEAIEWEGIYEMWNNEYRESQYVVLEYLKVHKKQITPNDLKRIKKLITTKSWWDTVDTLDSFIGDIVMKKPILKKEMIKWSKSNNIWLKRVAIDYQQKFKDKTDQDVLSEVILNNIGSDEFFINKAIGWSLREYSKTNPKWVKSFINDNKEKLNRISLLEARKYI